MIHAVNMTEPNDIPHYMGEAAVLFATGPSLTREAVGLASMYQKHNVVRLFGCNDAWRAVPQLDVLYACDKNWWKIHIDNVIHFPYEIWWNQLSNMGEWPPAKIAHIKTITGGSRGKGLNTAEGMINWNKNSGAQLINLAYHFGIKRFYLVGYDMNKHNGKHFFGEHPAGLNQSGAYGNFITAFDDIAKQQEELGIRIVNCSPESSLKCFDTATLECALALEGARQR